MSVPLIQNSWRWTICYRLLFMTHPEAWLGKPYHLTLPASELTFSFSQCVFLPPWAWCIQAWYTLKAPGTVLAALLCDIFLQNCFFLVSWENMCWFSPGGVVLPSVCVCCFLLILQAAEGHFKRFSWSTEGSGTQGATCAWQTSQTTASPWQQFIFHSSDAGAEQPTHRITLAKITFAYGLWRP